jgi:hypothetical protein
MPPAMGTGEWSRDRLETAFSGTMHAWIPNV